jgi:outer membrane biogenesis lipoprotein LolB
MSRRPVSLLILAITSFVLAACTSVTAPSTQNECGGIIMSDGRCSQ